MQRRLKPVKIGMLVMLVFAACQEPSNSVEGDWLIPKDQVYDGGPGKDGIPALHNPRFVTSAEATYLTSSDLVIGVKMGDVIRAYPHPILDWHEIINDELGGVRFAITYCPLTGSGISWDRELNGGATTFGVSGLLYNTNLIPYDRMTNSNWSQMKLQCVNGPLSGTTISTNPIIETTWQTWKQFYPQTMVVSSNTGHSRLYGTYPYGDYRTNNSTLFPISHRDERLPMKERVHGVIVREKSRVYRIAAFPDAIGTINDVLNGTPVILAGSRSLNFAVAFERRLQDGTELTFSPVAGALPIIMRDNEGTRWDGFGNAIDGPRTGTTLKHTRSYTAYWFAWATFFPGAEIH